MTTGQAWNVDFRLLDFCSDDDCTEPGVHAAHGRKARSLKIKRRGAPDRQPPVLLIGIDRVAHEHLDDIDLARLDALALADEPTVDTNGKASQALIASTYAAISDRIPRSFREICNHVFNDYGGVTTRGVNRALEALTINRKVASLTNPWWPVHRQRSEFHPGWYVRYDSPKLWQPGGFRDLLRVVAEQDMERTS